MRKYRFAVAGDTTTTYFPETEDDLDGFRDFLRRMGNRTIALDTETTDLHIFGREFACRLVQFGSTMEAWVLRVDRFREAITEALRPPRRFVIHNAPFDTLVLDRTGLARFTDLIERVFDTYILAHLLDPRTEAEGGAGLGLKPLSTIYVDPNAADTQTGLYEVFHREYHATKVTGWRLIDIDHPTYVQYAGLDVIYLARLLDAIGPLVRGNGFTALALKEHRVQRITTAMMRRGLRVDTVYTRDLVERLVESAERYGKVAEGYGVTKVGSTRQVAAALLEMGEVLTSKTASGLWKVDKDVLMPMADLDKQWERLERRDPNPLAYAVMRAKRDAKWAGTYAQAFLDRRDEADRIHPFINSLAARTARMSVSNPPLQQLPSSDWTIRRAIIADDGMVILASDYSQVELRVLAALADVPAMKQAIADGLSLHELTANLLWPDGWIKAQYKLAKIAGLAKVYGGGATTIARQTGAPMAEVKELLATYDRVYPEVRRYGIRLQREAQFGGGYITTPVGRQLPLDRERSYAATNYACQSTARDLLAAALIRIDDAGLSDHLLLPIHDEVLAQCDAADGPDLAHELGRLMASSIKGVPIEAHPDVYGPSWGHGYGYKDTPVAA